jgi:hypothetical protein
MEGMSTAADFGVDIRSGLKEDGCLYVTKVHGNRRLVGALLGVIQNDIFHKDLLLCAPYETIALALCNTK